MRRPRTTVDLGSVVASAAPPRALVWRPILALLFIEAALLAVTVAGLVAMWHPPYREWKLDPSRFYAWGGQALDVELGQHTWSLFEVPTNSVGGYESQLVLYENAQEIGPADPDAALVRDGGHGRYTHWGDSLIFSASDASDPRANGRSYVARSLTRLPAAARAGLAMLVGIDLLIAVVVLRMTAKRSSLVGRAQQRLHNVLSRSVPVLRTTCIVAIVVADIWLLSAIATPPRVNLSLDVEQMRNWDGLAWQVMLSESASALFYMPTNGGDGIASDLRVYEDGVELGPATADAGVVRDQGHGSYAHWGSSVYISSSDGGDPRANGHTYTASSTLAIHSGLLVLLTVMNGLAWGLLRTPAPASTAVISRVRGVALAAATLFVFWQGTALLRSLLDASSSTPLQPDAQVYSQLVTQMTHPFDTGMREPVWIWAVALGRRFFGPTDWGVRMVGSLGYLVAAMVLLRLGTSVSGSAIVGLIAAGFLLSNRSLAGEAVAGLRDTGVLIFVGSFASFAFARDGITLGKRIAGLTLAGMLLCGTRVNMMAPVVVLILYAWRAHRLSWIGLVIPMLGLSAMLACMFTYSYIHFGDPLYMANVHATWWRNYEFVTLKKVGCDGCASPEEVAVSHYAGSPTTAWHYTFGMRPFSEFLNMTVDGFRTLLFEPTDYFSSLVGWGRRSWLFVLLSALGMVGLLASECWAIVLVPFLLLGTVAFTVPLHMPARIFSPAAPFVCLFIAYGLWLIALGSAWLGERLDTRVFRRQCWRPGDAFRGAVGEK